MERISIDGKTYRVQSAQELFEPSGRAPTESERDESARHATYAGTKLKHGGDIWEAVLHRPGERSGVHDHRPPRGTPMFTDSE